MIGLWIFGIEVCVGLKGKTLLSKPTPECKADSYTKEEDKIKLNSWTCRFAILNFCGSHIKSVYIALSS